MASPKAGRLPHVADPRLAPKSVGRGRQPAKILQRFELLETRKVRKSCQPTTPFANEGSGNGIGQHAQPDPRLLHKLPETLRLAPPQVPGAINYPKSPPASSPATDHSASLSPCSRPD